MLCAQINEIYKKNVRTTRTIQQIEYAAAKEFPFHQNVFERAGRAWNDFYFRFLNCFENASDEVTSQRKVYFLLWNVHQSGKYHLTKVKCPNEKPQLLRRDDRRRIKASQWTFATFCETENLCAGRQANSYG